MVPLWDTCTNWRVLQAFVHVDNRVVLRILDTSDTNAVHHVCRFEHIRRKCSAKPADYFHRYVGAVLETDRTFLATWISRRTASSLNRDWRPRLPTGKVEFWIAQDIMLDSDDKWSTEMYGDGIVSLSCKNRLRVRN